MISYKDMTFCNFKDCIHWGSKDDDPDNCFRSLTDEVKKNAERWWGTKTDDPVPICIYSEKPDCYEEGK